MSRENTAKRQRRRGRRNDRQSQRETSTREPQGLARVLLCALAYFWWLLPIGLAFLLRTISFRHLGLAEFYSGRVRPILMWPLTALTNLLPISVSFFFLVAVILFGLTMLLRLLLSFRQERGHRLIYAARQLRVVAVVLALAFLSYMLFHGMNFPRVGLAAQLDLEITKHSPEQLYEAAVWLRDEAGALREELQEDEDGVYAWPEGETTGSMLAVAYDGYRALDDRLSRFDGQYVRPKIVPLSRYWSYTGTAGMFFPLLGEANVNTDMMPDEILTASLHEIAHTKGIAREDEANFMAFYTGIRHSSRDFRYAAYQGAFIHASNQLYSSDRTLWEALWEEMPDGIRRDIGARNVYWKAFEGKTQEKAQQLNNNFLVANGESDGTKSYGRMVDLVLAYYEQEVSHANGLTP